MRHLRHAATFAAACLALGACAIVGRPSGGDADEVPPQLIVEESTLNFQTNFRPRELVLEFDEYVVLKNASTDIVRTPTPASGRPSYEQRLRTVTVDLSEVEFRDSTTYQMQFGEAIQDLNEGNPATGLKYVFSTGSYLDSLELHGTVVDNLTGEPAIGALAVLYRSLSDTVYTQATPDYFAKTDSSGHFHLDYLAPGEYQLAAFDDANNNLRLNHGAEQVAFLDTTVTLVAGVQDSSEYILRLSNERPPLIATRSDILYRGLLRVTLNQRVPPDIEVRDVPSEVLATYVQEDSLFVAYNITADTVEQIVVAYEGETDTVSFRRILRSAPPELAFIGGSREVPGLADLALVFNVPLASVNPDSISTIVDSVEVGGGVWTVNADDPRELRWRAPTDTIPSFSVSFLPGALTTLFDTRNADTLVTEFKPRRASNFGDVDLIFAGLDSSKAYVVDLLNASGTSVRTLQLSPKQDRVKLARVAGGNYTVRLTTDEDGNGRYSPGDRRLRRQPEPVRGFVIEEVRPDWVVEQELDVTD